MSLRWLAAGLCAVALATPAEESRQRGPGEPSQVERAGLDLDAPEWVEDGAFVPLTVHLRGAVAPVTLHLLRDGEPDRRIAEVTVHQWREPLELSTRVRLPQSQSLRVLARDGAGRRWEAAHAVRVAGSSCLAPPNGNPLEGLGEVRAWLRGQGGGLELVSLLRHPMESGRRKDLEGRLLPRYLASRLEILRAGQPVLEATPYEGLAANPYWRLLVDDGAPLAVRWVDRDGQRYEAQAPVPEPAP